MPESISNQPAPENLNTRLEKFVKNQRGEVESGAPEQMSEVETLNFSREIVKALKNPDGLKGRAMQDAITSVEQEYGLPNGLVLGWAEEVVSFADDDGKMSEAEFYSMPKDQRGRQMLRIFESFQRASTPEEFAEYCQTHAAILLKYRNIMPAPYLEKITGTYSPEELAAIDSKSPDEVLALSFGRNAKETADHVGKWFSVEWPRYTTPKDVDNALADLARFITSKYALEFDVYGAIKATINRDFKKSFTDEVRQANNKQEDDKQAEQSISRYLENEFAHYHQVHFSN